MSEIFKFELGIVVKDKITGYQGVILGRTQYLTGCVQYGIQTQSLDDKGEMRDWQWLDESRLKLVDEKIVDVQPTIGGPSNAAPTMN